MADIFNFLIFLLNVYWIVHFWNRADEHFEEGDKRGGWIAVVISAVCGAAAATYVF